MYKLILFDLGGVVFTDGAGIFFKSISCKYQIPLSKVDQVFRGETAKLYHQGIISYLAFWQYVIKNLKLKESADALQKQWTDAYQVNQGVKQLIFKLRKKFKVYYLSENVPERINKLEDKFHFLSWFDAGIFTYNLKLRKTDQKIYLIALKRAGVQPEETIFIDDKEKNLEPAKKIGINTFLFISPKKLKFDLQEISSSDPYSSDPGSE